jgi:hypothetical protein
MTIKGINFESIKRLENIRHLYNVISRLKIFLVKRFNQIKMILIAPYFFSKIELATIDIHFSYRTI